MHRHRFDLVLIAAAALALPAAVLAQNAQPTPVPQRLIEPPPREPAIAPSAKETIPGLIQPEKGIVRPAGAVDPSTLNLTPIK